MSLSVKALRNVEVGTFVHGLLFAGYLRCGLAYANSVAADEFLSTVVGPQRSVYAVNQGEQSSQTGVRSPDVELSE